MSGAANGWVEVANSPSLNPAAFSVEFWVNATLTSSSQCPICKGAGGQWYITLNTGQTTFNNGWNGWQIQGHPLTSGETHHIVGVYAPPTMALYIDGALAASASVVGNSGSGTGTLTIFALSPGNYLVNGTATRSRSTATGFLLRRSRRTTRRGSQHRRRPPSASTSARRRRRARRPPRPPALPTRSTFSQHQPPPRPGQCERVRERLGCERHRERSPARRHGRDRRHAPGAATASAAASGSVRASVPQAGATGSAAATIGFEGCRCRPGQRVREAPAPTLRIASGAPQANATGDAPPPMV